jgi:diguanylate cyclase (GGDEF)-like protein
MVTEDTSGTTLRRMLPVALAVPLLCGFLFVRGERADAFGVAEGVLLVVVLGVFLFGLAVVSTTRELARSEEERDRLERRLEELAERDPLTNLFNRRRLTEEYGLMRARAERHGDSFALAMIDLDNLKPINDRLGHAAGDQVLIAAAQTLIEGVRATDAVARIGGDEFAILLADVELEEARTIVDELLRAISRPQVLEARRIGGEPVFVTASAGIAVGGSGGPTLDELMHEADQALYEAKAGGRSELRVAAATSSASG